MTAEASSATSLESASAEETAVPAWLNDSEQRAWRRLLAVECRMRERLDRELQESHGLSLGDYDVLVHLSEAQGRSLRMSELAERLLLSRSGLTRRVDGLVRSGSVERKACPDDGRGSLAVLSDAGLERLRRAAPTHVRGVRRYLIDPLGKTGGVEGLDPGLSAVERALDLVDRP
ncbi:MAG TPA: MarR family transcriptional regulator [Acidimicrobiales bacterium]|nr:MarR family transcriptional regulator [Acidimicrobiales bacterium]